MLYPVVESCLPTEILKAWDRYRLNREDKEDDPVVSKDKVLENLMIFLRHVIEGEEHRFLAETSFGDGMKRKESRKPPLRDEPTAATLIANTSVGRNQCIFCERAHASQDCQKISNLVYEDRKGQVMFKRCCLVCLKPGHMAKRCHSSVKCLICGRRHYALLCPDLRKDKISSKSREVDEEQHSTETLLTNLPLERKIYLKTITVRLRHKNKEVCVRALMDDGSHRSYIVKSLVAELDISPSGTEVLSQGLFGGGISPSMEYGRFTVTVESLDLSVENKEELLRFKEQTIQIMNAASFELRNWAHTGIKHLESQNVLGLKWDTETDELYCVHPEADMGISDIPSRPCDWFELLRSQWWEGHKWLYEPPEFWPYAEKTLPEEALVEIRKSVVVNLNINTKECLGSRFLYFSSYPRIVRMTACILRFCRNIRVNSDKLTKELSYEEIQRAEEALIRLIQSEWPSDIREKYTQTIQFYEENKILKVRSRLILGEDPEDFVRPTVLPDHPIVWRLIDYIHQKLHHAGVQTTLSHLRERFWIPRGRRVAIKPSNFIQDIKGTEVLDLDIVDAKHLRKRIRYLQNLRYQLRQRFQKEYLSELIRNPQLAPKRCNLSVGDIVLVGLDNVKRLNWPLGRVIEMFQGKDNIERVAKLRVSNGE
ncbi:uncharacterized protein NPIL_35041, partial [Nephila pilipes]